jgi:hypothetical protein
MFRCQLHRWRSKCLAQEDTVGVLLGDESHGRKRHPPPPSTECEILGSLSGITKRKEAEHFARLASRMYGSSIEESKP